MTPASPPGASCFRGALRIAGTVLLASACGDDTTGPRPPVPASIIVDPPTLTFSWVGESQRLRAEALDEAGTILTEAVVSWASTNPAAVTVSPAGVAAAAGAGQATITASSGAATASVSATVTLVPVSIEKISGDAQRGTTGSQLPESLVTEVRDLGGTPIPSMPVSWIVSGGGGAVTSSGDRTDDEGRAYAGWTLGAATGSQSVTARSGTLETVFTAEAFAPLGVSMVPASARIQVADSADFALALTGGDPGKTASWRCTAPDAAVVSIRPTTLGCRATGLAAGSTTVSAAVTKGADRGTASAEIEVGELSGAVHIAGIEPAVLVEGGAATIHGTGFAAVASENRVTIGSLDASISSATSTRLTLTVPRATCLPPRQALLLVSNPSATASRSVAVTPPPEETALAVGSFRTTPAGTGCLHLPGSASGGEYLIGVLSTSEAASSLTAVSLAGIPGEPGVVATSPAADAPGGARIATVATRMRIGGGGRAPPPGLGSPGALREWSAGRWEAEAQLKAEAGAELARLGRAPATSPPAGSPSPLEPGDRRTLWVAPGASCKAGTRVEAVVRSVGPDIAWLEDLANPAGGLTDVQLDTLDTFYATRVRPIHDRYFGEVSDVDGNGRILVLLTHEINKAAGAAGFVTPTDLYPTTECATSNHAEIFYGFVPEDADSSGGGVNRGVALGIYRILLAHEIAHLIQANAYVLGESGRKTIWEIEGGATLAEQLVAYERFGHGPRQNLGLAAVDQSEESRAWYWGGWIAEMASFFGWDGLGRGSGRVRGAPEECTWIGSIEEGNTGPCAGRHVYGVPSMLLRYVMDRWGEGYPGADAALIRRVTGSPATGFSTLEEVSGEGIEEILAGFYIALWGDGRPSSPGRVWDWMASWDLHDIFGRLPDEFRLQPRTSSSRSPRTTAEVRGGSSLYLHWTPTGSLAPTSIRVTAPSGAPVPGHVSLWAWRIR